MTQERKHSPLPFIVGNNGLDGHRSDNFDEVFTAFSKDNAAFIVHACNNHYKLVEALRELLKNRDVECLEDSAKSFYDTESTADTVFVFDKARLALAEAEAV